MHVKELVYCIMALLTTLVVKVENFVGKYCSVHSWIVVFINGFIIIYMYVHFVAVMFGTVRSLFKNYDI